VGIETAVLPNLAGQIDLNALLTLLAQRGINDALLECGPRLAAAFVAAGLVDELVLYQAPCWLGVQGRPLLQLDSPATMAGVQRWQTHDVTQLGPDWRVVLRPAL
jgi:diaminohydroxyphosphoribosylaminopyrimidine deaminase/5-amino-6-(5-phosphoribosylamino)uracil reductase